MIVNEEIKEFIEFRTDEDGTYFYYNDKDNIEQWSYKLDDLKEYITNLQQENARLKENNMSMQEEMARTWEKADLYKEVIEEVREYITSYSSIHTIQFGIEEDSLNDIELNKTLDEKTITEMTNRYLKVHDKLLQILDKVKN